MILRFEAFIISKIYLLPITFLPIPVISVFFVPYYTTKRRDNDTESGQE